MQEIMTDKQIEIILNLVADKFSACKDMAEVTASGAVPLISRSTETPDTETLTAKR